MVKAEEQTFLPCDNNKDCAGKDRRKCGCELCMWCRRDIRPLVYASIYYGQGYYGYYCVDCALYSAPHCDVMENWRGHMNNMGKLTREGITREWCTLRSFGVFKPDIHGKRVKSFREKDKEGEEVEFDNEFRVLGYG